jgi:hypothetical protein
VDEPLAWGCRSAEVEHWGMLAGLGGG